MKKRGKTKRKKRVLIALGVIAIIVIVGGFMFFPPMKKVPVTGKYTVATRDSFYQYKEKIETYEGDNGLRELPITFYYPEEVTQEKSCPLVVFSHGSTGVRSSNETLYRELTSLGYVVCTIDHPYQCVSTRLSNGKKVKLSMEFMKELQKEDPKKNKKQSVKNFKKWMEIRTGDINTVLDGIIANERNDVKDIVALIDKDRICVMGHSLGGSAALGIGRQRSDIKAVIALESAFLDDIKGVDDQNNFIFEEGDYPVPVLNIYSDASWSHLKEWSQYAENVKLLGQESKTVRNLHISGVGHIGLTDLSMTSPLLTKILDGGMKNAPQDTLKRINEVCVEFLGDVL